MSKFLDDMITAYNDMFNNLDNIPKKKLEFREKYINNREKLLSELKKEVDIYKKDKSNREQINKLIRLFWQIQTNEIITLSDEPSKKTCRYNKNCYRLNVRHNINKYDHDNNNFNNFASRIATFLGSLDEKISLQKENNKILESLDEKISLQKENNKKRSRTNSISNLKTKTKKRKIGGNYKKKSYKKKSYKKKSYKKKSYKKRLKKKI